MKRRICSYDLASVPEDGYVVTDDGGEIYLCNPRCLCIWAVESVQSCGVIMLLELGRFGPRLAESPCATDGMHLPKCH